MIAEFNLKFVMQKKYLDSTKIRKHQEGKTTSLAAPNLFALDAKLLAV